VVARPPRPRAHPASCRRRAPHRVPRHRARAAGPPSSASRRSASPRATSSSSPGRPARDVERPGLRAEEVDLGVYFTLAPQLPFSLSVNRAGVTTARLDGGGRARATVVCGFLGCDAAPSTAARRTAAGAAPDRGRHGPRLVARQFLRTAVEESNRRRPGGEAVLERMSELMFVEACAATWRPAEGRPAGWRACATRVGRALALLHERPARPGRSSAWASRRVSRAACSRALRPLHRPGADAVPRPVAHAARGPPDCATPTPSSSRSRSTLATRAEAAFSRAFRRAVGQARGRGGARQRARPAAPPCHRPDSRSRRDRPRDTPKARRIAGLPVLPMVRGPSPLRPQEGSRAGTRPRTPAR